MRKILAFFSLLAVIGLILMGIGLAFGASTQLYIDSSGIHYGSGKNQQTEVADDIETPKNLDIDVTAASVEILTGEKSRIEIDSSKYTPITYTMENGTLSVHQNFKFRISLFQFYFREDTVKIYLPANVSLQSAALKTDSGKITIGALNCGQITLRNTSGNVMAQNLTADSIEVHCTSGNVKVFDSTAENFSFYLTSGTLKADGIVSKGLTAKLTSGSAEINGKLTGANELRLVSGSLKMNLEDSLSSYSRQVSVTSGSVYINGEKNNGDDSNTGAPNSLIIKLTSGSARINFAS